jgi:hypothetical protein
VGSFEFEWLATRHREVVPDEGGREAGEREEDQQELRARRGARDGDPACVAARGADERHDALHGGDAEREDQGEVAEFGGHCFRVFCALCAWSIACFASGGM